MQRASGAALAFVGLLIFAADFSAGSARADDYLYASRRGATTVEGTVHSVSLADDRLVLIGTDDRFYTVDVYTADIILRGTRRLGETDDLTRGMRVEVVGTLLDRDLLQAARLRVLPAFRTVLPEPPLAEPALPLPPEPALPAARPQINLDVLVRDVDAVRQRATVLGDDDKRYALDIQGTDIILRGTERAGQAADLTRGMRVRLIGEFLPSGVVEADRIRVLPPPDAPAAVPLPLAPVVEDMSVYTGILIDARGLPNISRSPAPAIYGPAPDQPLLYPDRSHVPTPDEVQEQSIVRYYRVEADARTGIAGPRPLILTALAVLGPADDAVQLSAEDAARFQALDKRLRFTRTWKVGFLIPANQ